VEFSDVIRRRHMVRNYTPEPVDPAVVERVLERARRAPSAGFSQGVSFVVVTDEKRRHRLAELADEPRYVAQGFDPWISRAPVHVIVCTSEAAYRARYAEPDKAGTDPQSWPVPYWYIDAGAALMLLLLAAVDEGLDAGFAGPHMFEDMASYLGTPPDVMPIGLVTLGHGAPDRQSGSLRRGWKPIDDVVHYEEW
jgi:nitroreductase